MEASLRHGHPCGRRLSRLASEHKHRRLTRFRLPPPPARQRSALSNSMHFEKFTRRAYVDTRARGSRLASPYFSGSALAAACSIAELGAARLSWFDGPSRGVVRAASTARYPCVRRIAAREPGRRAALFSRFHLRFVPRVHLRKFWIAHDGSRLSLERRRHSRKSLHVGVRCRSGIECIAWLPRARWEHLEPLSSPCRVGELVQALAE